MGTLIWIAIVLFVLWLAAVVLFKVAGLLIHLLLIIAVIAALFWVIRRFMGAPRP